MKENDLILILYIDLVQKKEILQINQTKIK